MRPGATASEAAVKDGRRWRSVFVAARPEGEPPPPEVSPKGEGVRGDLHVAVRVSEHDLFERDGDHLLMEMPISFTQASLGAEVEVPTIEGRIGLVGLGRGKTRK